MDNKCDSGTHSQNKFLTYARKKKSKVTKYIIKFKIPVDPVVKKNLQKQVFPKMFVDL